MEKGITYVGMDAHKVAIKVAVLVPGETKPVEWQLANEKAAVRRMVRKVQRLAPGEVRFCYEAGPCGYALQRWIVEAGASCIVVAPSLIPRKPGDRIKTDRRDARKLAELFRAGLLTEVHPPTVEDEAVRDLCRAREDAHEDLVRCRHRVSKMLLRRGWIWNGSKKAWGQGHRLWLRSLRFEQQADQVVFDDYLRAIDQVEERLRALEQHVEAVSQLPAYAEAVGALRCFRGIDTLTAMGLVAELHDFMRFDSARGLMAFLGLVSLRVLFRRLPAPRGDHQGRQPPCSPPAHRGRLALSPSAQPRKLEAPPPGPARRGHRARRQGDVSAQPSLQPHARQGQAALQGCRRHRPRARWLRLGGAPFQGRLERRSTTLSIRLHHPALEAAVDG